MKNKSFKVEGNIGGIEPSWAMFDYYACKKLGTIDPEEMLWCLHCEKASSGKAWSAARQCPTPGCDGGWRDCSRVRW